jgi:branched-chain amino acid transport system substrate-binding protein
VRHTASGVLGVACGVLLLGACVFPGSVQTTVKIGLSAPFEGLYRDQGYEALNAVRLAVRQHNEAGSVAGRYLVELVALNDFNEAEEAIQQAGEMVADPGILAAVGGWSLQTARAVTPEYKRLGLAFLAPEMDGTTLAAEAARLARDDQGLGEGAVLYASDAADGARGEAFGEAFRGRGGSIVFAGAPQGDDWAERLAGSRLDAPDFVFVAADVVTAADWIATLREAGFDGVILGGPELGSPLLVDIAGDAAEGVVFVSPFPPLADDPEFVSAYRELSGGAPPGPAAGWAYTAASHLLDAMESLAEKRGKPSRAAMQEALSPRWTDQDNVYFYVIQPNSIFSPYQPLTSGY